MTKTQRRRTARVARQVAAARARAEAWKSRRAAMALLTNHHWRQLTDTLEGLLLLEFPSPFTDLELLCPQEAWIVVDLAYVRVNVGVAKGQRQAMQRVIAALETICVLGETLRAWSDLYEAFWTRVLTSDMNQEQLLCDNDHRVGDMIRFMKAKGTHVAFRWQGRRFRSGDVIAPISRFLHAGVGIKSPRYKPVQVALRVENAYITTADIKVIHDLLTLPSDTGSSSDLLCDLIALKELSLRSNPLYAHHHEALTALLEGPETRRIDGIRLDDTTPHNEIQPPTYASIFQRTLSLVLRSRPGPQSDTVPVDDGVSLSFDDCKCLDTRLIEAIGNALLQASRPVRALSLAGVTPPDFGSVMRLTRLILTPPPTATDDFQLDITGLNNERSQSEAEEALIVSLAEMVAEAVPRVNSVLGDRVSCRLHTPQVFEDQFLMVPVSLPVSTFVFYDVVSVTHNGCFQVALPEVDERSHRVTGWIRSTSIASIRVGETYVVGSNCTSLILNGCNGPQSAAFNPGFVASVAVTIGARLERLSLQNCFNLFSDIPSLIARCPQLVELNVHNSGSYSYYNSKWSQTTPDTGRLLQALNVSDCHLNAAGLATLPELPSLRYLNLENDPLDGEALACLLERLRTNRTLQFVNVSKTHKDSTVADKDYAVRKAEIEKHLRDEYVTLDERIAFLGVIPHYETARQSVPLDTIASIFQFAGTSPRCVVSW